MQIVMPEGRPFPESTRPLYEVKAGLFKGLAHPVRVRLLELISGAEEVPVSELIAETGLEASHLSQHLAVLRRHGLVVGARRASQVYYRLAYPEVGELLAVARRLLGLMLENSQQHAAAVAELPAIADRP